MSVLRGKHRFRLADGREAAVRTAAPGDSAALLRLVDEVAAEPQVPILRLPGTASEREVRNRITQAAAMGGDLFLVAVVGSEVVGSVQLHRDEHPRSQHVVDLGISVLRQYRSLGVGTALLETALAWAADEGFLKVTLGVFPHNEGAIRFYERHGFVREGLRRRQFVRERRELDQVLMARFLDEMPPVGRQTEQASGSAVGRDGRQGVGGES